MKSMRTFEPWILQLALLLLFTIHANYKNMITIIRAGYYVSWKTCYLYVSINFVSPKFIVHILALLKYFAIDDLQIMINT